ncbi:MAG TPA: hypothetical protein VMD97_13270 [Candidatus Aquilonibacter sp.]|nr:hypothetical protein [Candidatus Aquilonibacter sp.]
MKQLKYWLALCAALLMVFSATSVFAATDMTGTWTGSIPSPDGNSFALTFVFKQEGAKLTGSVQGPQGDPIAISNGKIDGDSFSFTVSFNGTTITHTGTITRDEIKMTTKSDHGDFPPQQMTLKRSVPSSPPPATPPP